jgi:hypothetical protein
MRQRELFTGLAAARAFIAALVSPRWRNASKRFRAAKRGLLFAFLSQTGATQSVSKRSTAWFLTAPERRTP